MRNPIVYATLLAAIACGCSGSDSPPAAAPTDTGPTVDSAVGDVATDAGDVGADAVDAGDTTTRDAAAETDAPAIVNCGSAPYAFASLTINEYASAKPLPGTKIVYSSCASTPFVTDADGKSVVGVSTGTPFYLTFTNDAEIPYIIEEVSLDKSLVTGFSLIPTALEAIITGWSSTTPTLLIQTAIDGALGACATRSGVTYAVTGHPEAKIVYLKDGTPPTEDPTMTSTGSTGLALVSGLPAASWVSITGIKTGCTVKKPSIATGRARLEAGYLTLVTGAVTGGP